MIHNRLEVQADKQIHPKQGLGQGCPCFLESGHVFCVWDGGEAPASHIKK